VGSRRIPTEAGAGILSAAGRVLLFALTVWALAMIVPGVNGPVVTDAMSVTSENLCATKPGQKGAPDSQVISKSGCAAWIAVIRKSFLLHG
jgi:hypothetical protein